MTAAASSPPNLSPARFPFRPFGEAWRQCKEFSGLGGGATYLWPRWIVLRAVGIIYIVIFAGIIAEGQALIGPHGLSPIARLFLGIQQANPGSFKSFASAPSLFWAGSGQGMIATLAWTGLAAAAALVLNLLPRIALFACWLIFLSFVSVWRAFLPLQPDDLMLETALLCIPFAPAGLRPGLGAESQPRPIAVFMMRWLLFRVMFESGLLKLITGDPHWRDFTAMDIMYETAPFPTILGYLDHQMPHVYHLFEFAFTFVAELAAPLLAVFGGRRGRWIAFAVWVAFQAGIQLTNNFGYLNTGAIVLGVLLLDDSMLVAGAGRMGLRKLGDFLASKTVRRSVPEAPTWRLYGLRAALGTHFYLTLCAFFTFVWITRGMPTNDVPRAISGPRRLFWNLHSANQYNLYAKFDAVRYGFEFEGSNDGGKTWRAYDFRYMAQRVDRICPFVAPRLPRFETALYFEVSRQGSDWSRHESEFSRAVATQLMEGNGDVIRLFPSNPFPDRPPAAIRLRYYRLSFTDLGTRRKDGHFWRKHYKDDYTPMLYMDENGQAAECSLAAGDAALRNKDFPGALALYERQYAVGYPTAGFRMAEMYARGLGTEKDEKNGSSRNFVGEIMIDPAADRASHSGRGFDNGS